MKQILLVLLVLFLSGSYLNGQLNVVFQSQLTYSDNLNDIWGYENAGREYAIVGLTNGVSIVDITIPTSPVEVSQIPDIFSNWRDMKTWQNFAYVTNESGNGLMIIDLSGLPGGTTHSFWTVGGFSTAHNIFIDENGYGYLFGSNLSGTTIIDIASNPLNPSILGHYSTYVHDGFVRNDTFWASQIGVGTFAVIDVSDKTNPVVLATQPTPDLFTHACWLSDDGQTLFTFDERSGAFLASYDVSDLSNISELDRYQSYPGNGIIPHNTFVLNDFAINSYYTSGITIVDGNRPDVLVEVGFFDTSPFSTPDFRGCWGVYPYFSSGTIVASDRQQGLFVLKPNYVRASYLEGTITDLNSGNAINGATIDILSHSNEETSSDILGQYGTGIPNSGNFDVVVSAPGYPNDTIFGVNFNSGGTTILNVQLGIPPPISVNFKVLLEGPFQTSSGTMSTTLKDLGLISLTQPFNTAPWSYGGTEAVALLSDFPAQTVDWVLLEVRDATDPNILIDQKAGILLNNGDIVLADGSGPVAFNGINSSTFYKFSVKTRSHLAVITQNGLPAGSSVIDFSTPSNVDGGTGQLKSLGSGAYGLSAGDFNNDGVITVDDYNFYKTQASAINQYNQADCNKDRVVSVADYNLFRANSGKIGKIYIRY